MNLFCSLPLVRLGSWSVKASSFDDQIIVFMLHEITTESNFKIFYNEEHAHQYLESLNYDQSNQINQR